jgi:hypothetical protein
VVLIQSIQDIGQMSNYTCSVLAAGHEEISEREDLSITTSASAIRTFMETWAFHLRLKPAQALFLRDTRVGRTKSLMASLPYNSDARCSFDRDNLQKLEQKNQTRDECPVVLPTESQTW